METILDKNYAKLVNAVFQNFVECIKSPRKVGINDPKGKISNRMRYLFDAESWVKNEDLLFDMAEVFLGIETIRFKKKLNSMIRGSIDGLLLEKQTYDQSKKSLSGLRTCDR